MKRIIAVGAAVLALAGCGDSTPTPTEAEKYKERCRQAGGLISVDYGWTNTYNCVGQTTGPQLPELKG